MGKPIPPSAPRARVRWIIKDQVWHARAKRYIRRKDGLPFRFPIFVKA